MRSVFRRSASSRRLPGVLVASALFALSACSVVQQQALEPVDWVAAEVSHYPVSGAGAWARLRKQPLVIGPFTAEVAAQSLWSSLPTSSTSDVQVSVGSDSERGHQLRSGTVIQNNESELQLTLLDLSGSLAELRCRQRLYSETRETGLSRNDGSDSFSMYEPIAYASSLSCMAKGLSSRWPTWQLDLRNDEPLPLRGSLGVDGDRFEVVGSQASTVGQVAATVSYEIRRGERTVALIDRSGDGQLSLLMPVGEKQHLAFAGAAAVLLLARDPLEN